MPVEGGQKMDRAASRRARCSATRSARGRSRGDIGGAERCGVGPGPGRRSSPGPRPRRSARRGRKSRAAALPAGCRRRCGVRTRGSTAPRTGGAARVPEGSSAARRRRSAAPRGPRMRRRGPRSDRSGPGRRRTPSASRRAYWPTAGFSGAAAAMTAAARPLPITTRPCWPLSHRRCSAAVQTSGLSKRLKLRPHLPGSGLLASDQCTSALKLIQN